jgi:hypothetical protein
MIESASDSRIWLPIALYFGILLSLALIAFKFFFYSNKTQSEWAAIWIFGLALMIIPFLLASNIFLFVGSLIEERLLYIPSMGFCLLVGCLWYKMDSFLVASKKPLAKLFSKGLLLGFVVVLVSFSYLTIQRNGEWYSEQSLFESAAKVCPNSATVQGVGFFFIKKYC